MMKTTAKREGDDYILNGSKIYITNAPIADFVTVEAFVDRSRGLNGIGLFIVEEGTPGFTKGQKLRKCGVKSAETGELIFENCKIPAANIIGDEINGWQKAVDVLTAERSRQPPGPLGSQERHSRQRFCIRNSGCSSVSRSDGIRRSPSRLPRWQLKSRRRDYWSIRRRHF